MTKLSSNYEMPMIGLGTWQSSEEEVYRAVRHAIELGYQHVDCAPIYLNEEVIGRALKDCLADKLIARERLWVTSKLWNSYHAAEDVEQAVKNSLADLQLDYLDLLLIHWPVAFRKSVGLSLPDKGDDFLTLDMVPLTETWQAMEALVVKGLVRSIGVSNFSISKLKPLLNENIQPVVNQVECHPYLSQQDLLDFCRANDVQLIAYSPLGSAGRPAQFKTANESPILENEIVSKIAIEHDASPAQVILAWQLQRQVAVVPKSTNPSRMKENLQACELQLSPDEVASINNLNINYRYMDGSFWEVDQSPYTQATIWE